MDSLTPVERPRQNVFFLNLPNVVHYHSTIFEFRLLNHLPFSQHHSQLGFIPTMRAATSAVFIWLCLGAVSLAVISYKSASATIAYLFQSIMHECVEGVTLGFIGCRILPHPFPKLFKHQLQLQGHQRDLSVAETCILLTQLDVFVFVSFVVHTNSE